MSGRDTSRVPSYCCVARAFVRVGANSQYTWTINALTEQAKSRYVKCPFCGLTAAALKARSTVFPRPVEIARHYSQAFVPQA